MNCESVPCFMIVIEGGIRSSATYRQHSCRQRYRCHLEKNATQMNRR